jgi:hypothetical protein
MDMKTICFHVILLFVHYSYVGDLYFFVDFLLLLLLLFLSCLLLFHSFFYDYSYLTKMYSNELFVEIIIMIFLLLLLWSASRWMDGSGTGERVWFEQYIIKKERKKEK